MTTVRAPLTPKARIAIADWFKGIWAEWGKTPETKSVRLESPEQRSYELCRLLLGKSAATPETCKELLRDAILHRLPNNPDFANSFANNLVNDILDPTSPIYIGYPIPIPRNNAP